MFSGWMTGEEKKRCKITGMRTRGPYSKKNCGMKIDDKTKGDRREV